MVRPQWAPPEVDIERPSAARMYDFYLGGSHHFAADREAARQVLSVLPDTPNVARANRAFLGRCVRHLAQAGIRQFLDLGSGMPTSGNVHEIAGQVSPHCHVAYVDIDPTAVAHSRELLADVPGTAVIQADLRQPDDILAHPDLDATLDLNRPVAVLMFAVLHFIAEADQPSVILHRLRTALAPGSCLAISHGTHEGREEEVERLRAVYDKGGNQVTSRSRAQIAAFFEGFEPVPPGVVWVPQWHPEPDDDVHNPYRSGLIGGVGRKV
jgi:SAM-dependent methyltransferase